MLSKYLSDGCELEGPEGAAICDCCHQMQEGLQNPFPVILWTSGLALLQSWVYLDHFRVPGGP